MKKSILFDLDGTLIDSTKAIVESFCVSFEKHKKTPPDKEKITRLIGYPLDTMFAKLGVETELIDSYVDVYKKHYISVATQKTTLLDGAKESVRVASEFARVAVVTTKTRRYSLEILDHLGIGGMFETVVGRECVVHPKPHPEPIMVALKRMGLEKNGVFLVGDTMLDLLAAKEAGISFVGVMGGYEDVNLFKKECSVLKNSSLEAVYYIKKRKV